MARQSSAFDHMNQLKTLFRFGVGGDLLDGQLLQRYLASKDGADHAAFAVLVERHGPMVFGVCRQVLGNPHDAQDAFQATFLVLARKADSIKKADSLSAWLHGVALRVSRRAKFEAGRQRVHETRSAARRVVAVSTDDRSDGWPELHDEIQRLPERYREPIVLCYLQGLSIDEASVRMDCPKGTILSRLSRARERLRQRLVRRGLAPSAAVLAGPAHRVTAALPAGLLDVTVRASLGFAGARTTEAAAASAAVTLLARSLLNAMTITKLSTLGAAALACGFAWGGIYTYGQIGGQEPGDAAPIAQERQATLRRSVERLQFELEESERRNAEMKKTLQDIRTDVKALGVRPRPTIAVKAADRLVRPNIGDAARAVSRLADALKLNPARPKDSVTKIYMMDLETGGISLIADEPAPGLDCCGMPRWSHDGARIVFEAALSSQWPRARLWSIEVRNERPIYTEFGDGNAPTFSPDDQRIAFSLFPGIEGGPGGGMWMMRASGSGRHRVGDFGVPYWSPDGGKFLINGYTLPTRSILADLETQGESVVEVPGHQIFSWPNWAGPGMLVTALAPSTKYESESIALIDVSKPSEAKIVETLWKRSADQDFNVRWPIYRPETRQCFFVSDEPGKRTIYSVRIDEDTKAREAGVVERQNGRDLHLGSLTLSPDGRYLLFHSNQLGPR